MEKSVLAIFELIFDFYDKHFSFENLLIDLGFTLHDLGQFEEAI
jgi:hypothetical protein